MKFAYADPVYLGCSRLICRSCGCCAPVLCASCAKNPEMTRA